MTKRCPFWVDIDSKDKQMYRDCLAGISVRTIAKRYSVTEPEALAAMDRCLTPLDLQMRLHTLQLELDRLDEMENVFHASMLKGDHAPSHLMICPQRIEGRLRRPSRPALDRSDTAAGQRG